jgi:hypothetical protein
MTIRESHARLLERLNEDPVEIRRPRARPKKNQLGRVGLRLFSLSSLWRRPQKSHYSDLARSRVSPSVFPFEPQSGAVASRGGKHVGNGIAPRVFSEGF